MCCLTRKVTAPERLIDSKVNTITVMGIQYRNMKHKITELCEKYNTVKYTVQCSESAISKHLPNLANDVIDWHTSCLPERQETG